MVCTDGHQDGSSWPHIHSHYQIGDTMMILAEHTARSLPLLTKRLGGSNSIF